MSPPPVAGAARTAQPARRPVAPRRVSGPARRPVGVTTPPPVRAVAPPLHRLVDHPWLDRLIRGRTWIGIVGFALIGIVAMQVALLKLNAGIGRSVDRATQLTRENSLLTMQVSTLRAADLRQAVSARQAMVYPPPGDVRYLTAGRGDAGQAAGSIVAPPTTPAGLGGGGSTGSATPVSSGSTSTQTQASSAANAQSPGSVTQTPVGTSSGGAAGGAPVMGAGG